MWKEFAYPQLFCAASDQTPFFRSIFLSPYSSPIFLFLRDASTAASALHRPLLEMLCRRHSLCPYVADATAICFLKKKEHLFEI